MVTPVSARIAKLAAERKLTAGGPVVMMVVVDDMVVGGWAVYWGGTGGEKLENCSNVFVARGV